MTLLGGSGRTVMGDLLGKELCRSGRTLREIIRKMHVQKNKLLFLEARRERVCPHLYRLSRWGLSLRGGGDTLRSESESDTGLRGRDAEEVGREAGREADQVGPTGEDLGLGRVDTPERDLE